MNPELHGNVPSPKPVKPPIHWKPGVPEGYTGEDLTGKIFCRLVVLGHCGRSSDGKMQWHCRCICGREISVVGASLQQERTRSCGCLKRDLFRRRNITHGAAFKGSNFSPEYRTWRAIKQRCSDVNAASYKYYGSRGIRLCERWCKYENFLADMGSKPSREYTIERIDPNGSYGPENCKWATRKEQNNNKRNNHFLIVNGIRKTLAQWSDDTGIGRAALHKSSCRDKASSIKLIDNALKNESSRKYTSNKTA